MKVKLKNFHEDNLFSQASVRPCNKESISIVIRTSRILLVEQTQCQLYYIKLIENQSLKSHLHQP